MRKIKTEPCSTCGLAMTVTPATLAAGMSHVSCRHELRAALTASGGTDLDAHAIRYALRIWAVRRDLARAQRIHGITS